MALNNLYVSAHELYITNSPIFEILHYLFLGDRKRPQSYNVNDYIEDSTSNSLILWESMLSYGSMNIFTIFFFGNGR